MGRGYFFGPRLSEHKYEEDELPFCINSSIIHHLSKPATSKRGLPIQAFRSWNLVTTAISLLTYSSVTFCEAIQVLCREPLA